MCRLAAYLGPEIVLQEFLLDPEHSLYKQSWAPQELRYARLNADGFGFGWYSGDESPAIYRNHLPIWSDTNLSDLARSLSADMWLAMVRSATDGFANGTANTQPFRHQDLLFVHNGFIENFNHNLRGQIRDAISTEIEAGIEGNTDSEYLFALIRQTLTDEPDTPLEEAMRDCLYQVDEWLDGHKALLNIVLTDGVRIYASRHALHDPCPSLYYTTDDENFPEGAQLVSSERLTSGESGDAEFWQSVPEHHLLILDPEEPPELIEL